MSFEELRCSTDFTSGIHEHLMSLSAVNIFLSIAAVLGNTLIFVALRRESSLHPPSKLLFHNLATTDLCVGLIAEPLNVAYTKYTSKTRKNRNFFVPQIISKFFSVIFQRMLFKEFAFLLSKHHGY